MKKKYKVDVVVKYFYPVAAGIEINVLETYRRLAEKGWDITIHSIRDNYTQKNVYSEFEEIKGLKVVRYKSGFINYLPKIDYDQTDFVCLHNFDIFPHTFIYFKVLIDKLIRNKKYLLFITPHGGFNPDWKLFDLKKRVIKALYHYIIGVPVVNYVADGARAVSEWEKVRMIAWGIKKNKVKVISNGLEDEAYIDPTKRASREIKKLVKQAKPYVIQIGRVNKIKNFEITIQALVHLPYEYKFIIVGPIQDQEYKNKLDKLIIDLGLTKRVIFAGVVRGLDKYYLIKNAEAMTHMARWESFCNVVNEGMSQGIMCFVANNTALPYLIKDGVNGFLVKSNDEQDLVRKLILYFNNKDSIKYLRIKNKNIKDAFEFSWKRVSEKMANFYIEQGII